MLKELLTQEEGQGMTEYALIVGVIAVAAIAILYAFKDQLKGVFSNLAGAVGKATNRATSESEGTGF